MSPPVQDSTGGLRTAAVAACVTVVYVLPVFLTGAVAPQMRQDLRFGVAALGIAMSAFVATQAVLSGPFGRLADRLGGARSLLVASVISAGASFAIGGFVRGWVGLAVCLAVAGTANALGQPAASRLVALRVRRARQGIAFGAFQSSKPIAGLLAGLAVPVIALPVGWRAAFFVAGAGGVVMTFVLAGVRPEPPPPRATVAEERVRLDALALLMTGIALGFAAAKVFSSFLADASVAAGLGLGPAGLLLAASGAIAITARLAVGVLADRRAGSQLGVVAWMLASGAAGFALLATGRPAGMVAGTVLVGAGAWGYNGLFYLSVTRLMPARPAAGTGLMLSGASAGGAIGPVVFGFLVDRISYGPAWLVVAVWVLLAAGCMRSAEIRLTDRRNLELTDLGPGR